MFSHLTVDVHSSEPTHTRTHFLFSLSSRSRTRDSSRFAEVVTACSLCVCRAVPISQTPSCTPWDRTALASGEFTHLHTHTHVLTLNSTVHHLLDPADGPECIELDFMNDWQSWSWQTDVAPCFKRLFRNGCNLDLIWKFWFIAKNNLKPYFQIKWLAYWLIKSFIPAVNFGLIIEIVESNE